MPLSAFADPSADHIATLRAEVMPVFVGTHNYTKGVAPHSASGWRTILDFKVGDPIVIEGHQFVMWTICGRSFMISQIRKMLYAVLCCSHGQLTIGQLMATFSQERWALSKVPGDGLFLDQVVFESTRAKLGIAKDNRNTDMSFTAFRPDVENWKERVLLPHIARMMSQDAIFENWREKIMIPYPPHPQDDPNYPGRCYPAGAELSGQQMPKE
jgi:tRNA pseudouridine38-40 synthase